MKTTTEDDLIQIEGQNARPGADQLRRERAESLKSDAINHALTASEERHAAVERSYKNFIEKTIFATAVMVLIIFAETWAIYTQAQRECAPAKTWGYQGKSQTPDVRKGLK